jgi:drug/metabolite transporter (DMT)-like permease
VDWVVFFACVAVWGSAFAGLKIAVADVQPAWVASLRMIVAAAFLAALLPLLRERLPPLSDAKTWRAYAVIGVIGTAVPFALFAFAVAHAPSAIVAICNGGSPFFTALLAHVLLAGERLTPRRAISVGLGFAGLAVLTAPGLMNPDGKSAETIGIIAAITGAACYAIANIQVKQAPLLPAATATTIYCIAGAAAALPFSLLVAPAPIDAGAPSLIAVFLLGVFATALGGVGFVYLVQRRGPVFTAFTTYLMPVWALGVGVLFLGERPGTSALIALGLILAALVLFNWRGRTAHAKGRSGHQG